jgi:hypothetical protein
VRKILLTILVGAGVSLAGGGLVAAAHANSTCSDAGGLPTASTSQVQVCVTKGPVQGTASASGDPATQQGYVVADGSPSNPGALGGYVGVDSGNGGEVVACSGQGTATSSGVPPKTLYSGEYQPDAGTPADGSGNNTVVAADGTVNLPAPVGAGGACDAHQ